MKQLRIVLAVFYCISYWDRSECVQNGHAINASVWYMAGGHLATNQPYARRKNVPSTGVPEALDSSSEIV